MDKAIIDEFPVTFVLTNETEMISLGPITWYGSSNIYSVHVQWSWWNDDDRLMKTQLKKLNLS